MLGREYFELAAMRFRPPAEAKAMRKQNAAAVFTAGLIIAAFVSIPIVIWRRRCSAWRSWSTCTSASPARGRS